MVTHAIFMTMKARKREIAAGEFKAKCLALFDEVETQGSELIVTKRGRPVARVVPLYTTRRSLAGSLVHEEDLIAPVDVAWQTNES
jgi:prevent-host-death family protein